MSTLTVTVDKSANAYKLAEWLKNIVFVHEVNIDLEKHSTGNAKAIKEYLDEIKSKQLFSEITDPVAYQRKLRDEWN